MRVVVVGAGPVGMTAALLLARHGVPTTVLEATPTREMVGSRSICVQRDVLDILTRAGVGAEVAEVGVTWTHGRTYYRSHQVGEIRFPEMATAAYPPFVNTPQTVVELLLEQRISSEPLVDLRYGQKVTGLTQDASGVVVSTKDSTYEGTHCVAADGARSTVRALLGLPFDGLSYDERFLIADIRADLGFTAERRFYFDPPWNPGRQVLVHPQPGGVWRIDWQVPADFDLANEDLDGRIREIVGEAPYEIVWLSVYRFHQRRVPQMQVGKVLLAGDAAHVMSPFGARGLNSGIADADNLAWKIALDRESLAGPALLPSYDKERGDAAAENLRVTGNTMRFLVPQTEADRAHREDVLTRAVSDESARPEIDAGKLAEPYSYEDSPLTTTSGTLCPDARLMRGGRLRELGTFTVLTNWSEWHPTDAWERAIVGDVLPLEQEHDTTLADALNLKPRQVAIIRPDGHIAATLTESAGGLAAPINAALRRATGW
jgi:2-polyprenyl-6-methoxyphenol hydroxylase-like FAD-dependent oxidoreductase